LILKIFSKQEFLTDLITQVLIPIGIMFKNQTMKKYAKRWISSTKVSISLTSYEFFVQKYPVKLLSNYF